MSYPDRLEAAVAAKKSACLVGLDPHLALVPTEFEAVHSSDASREERARSVGDFLVQVIDVVAEHVPAVKPQSAFFEALGADGAREWERVVAAAHAADLLVIGDVKRGDIGSTAAAYAEAFLAGTPGTAPDTLCDAITLNPFLGTDSIRPFLEACDRTGKGIYVLVRTSNPSSEEFQAQGEPTLSERVADAVVAWGAERRGESGFSSVGAVVGATHPQELAELRARMPHAPFLIPGYGAQGGGADEVAGGFVAPGPSGAGTGAIVNSSRGILFAYRDRPDTPWKDATRDAVVSMSSEIQAALSRRG